LIRSSQLGKPLVLQDPYWKINKQNVIVLIGYSLSPDLACMFLKICARLSANKCHQNLYIPNFSGFILNGSLDKTNMSASFSSSIVPLKFSSKLVQAAFAVHACIELLALISHENFFFTFHSLRIVFVAETHVLEQ